MVNLEYGRAICYSGYRRGQRPGGAYPSTSQIKEDLDILVKEGFKYIRMYDPLPFAMLTCQVIREHNIPLKVMVGLGPRRELNNPNCAWDHQNSPQEYLDENKEFNEYNLKKFIEFVKVFDDIIFAVSIGNENTPDWGANTISEERLIYFADTFKRELKNQLVTFNEGAREWVRLTKLAEHLDFISIHSYPLWYGNKVEEAVATNDHDLKMIQEIYKDKLVIFTECGWATKGDGNSMKEGYPSEDNQKIYLDEFFKYLDDNKVIAFIFEAFDEPWKGSDNENEPEKHWGIYNEDRTPKKCMQK